MATKRGKKSATPAHDEFWGHMAVDMPRADIELNTKADKRARLYRVWVRGSVILLPISLLAVISFIPTLLEAPPEPVQQVNELASPTKPAAITAVEAWLASTPGPLPGGRILSWDGMEIQQNPSVTVDPDSGQTVEKQGLHLHKFTLSSEAGTLYTTAIQVAYSEIRGALVMSTPALVPYAPDDSSQWPELISWPNLAPVGVTEPMTQAAEAWVKAFTSGDPNTLRLAVADQDEKHSYVPLVQADYEAMTIEASAARPLKDGSVPESPEEVIAKVSFGVVWPGQDTGAAKDKSAARVVYDVLILKANTAAPVIVAWGPAGTGESLAAYGNALTDRQISSEGLTGPAGDGESAAPKDSGTKTGSGAGSDDTDEADMVDPVEGFTGPPEETESPKSGSKESFDYTTDND